MQLDDPTLAHLLADEADRIAGAGFVVGRVAEYELKEDGSPVSAIDVAVEARLLEILREERPDDGVIGEEVGAHGVADSRRRWTLDGIDGTSGYVSGSPLWSTLIGLVVDGVPHLGVSTSVGQHRRWWAAVGGGSWSAPLLDSGAVGSPRLLRSTSRQQARPSAWVEDRPQMPPGIARLRGRVLEVEMTTHPAKMVAAGDLDVAFLYAAGVWDLVPLVPLVTEAGGRCFGTDGGPLSELVGDVIFTTGTTAADLPALLAR